MGVIEDNKEDIINLHTKSFWSANMIAKKYCCSRYGIILALRSWGIETSKHGAGWVDNICPCGCGQTFPVKRSVMRRVLEKGEKGVYFNRECRMKEGSKNVSK